MSLTKLSLSYRCHNSIGNSLDLKVMTNEFIKTFVLETDAVMGSFYLMQSQLYKNIVSIGKKIFYDVHIIENKLRDNKIVIDKYNDNINILIYKLNKGCVVFAYEINTDLDFIISILESLVKKLDISIDSCLNVDILKESNLKLLKQKEELEKLTKNLQNEVELATKENLKKEKQIFEQLKMAQMGELIGNIAHQWRQPLSVISTAASGMKIKKEMDILKDDDFFTYTQNIVDSSYYLSNTIDEFRDYIKESNKEKGVIVQDRLKMAIKLVESSFSLENIRIIEGHIENEDAHFHLVLGDLLQVLLSILNNAKDALIINDIKDRWIKYELIKKDYLIQITIEDNAGGIEEEILHKIFNPYFTTKHQFQGTGIGLYSGYEIIVNKLNGRLFVKNTEHGAKFFIELPLNINYVI